MKLRVDLIAEALADLGDAKANAAGIDDVLEVGEDSLGRFRAEVGDTRFVFQSADERLEHEVERSGSVSVPRSSVDGPMTLSRSARSSCM